jgi:hypothetical protein
MTTLELLFLLSALWMVIAFPAAIGTSHIDHRRSAAIIVTLGPFAYIGLALCRRHRASLTAETIERRYPV